MYRQASLKVRVEQIGVFYTTLTTIDNKVVLIPNGTSFKW